MCLRLWNHLPKRNGVPKKQVYLISPHICLIKFVDFDFGQVRNTWANQICIKDWGRITRARITLRQQLKREPTPEEIDEALDTENKYFNVTPEQVGRAFTKGEEVGILSLISTCSDFPLSH